MEIKLWRQLLLNGAVNLFWKEEILVKYISEMINEGFDIYEIDCSKWKSNNYLNELADAFNYRNHYGASLHSFDDGLGDLTSEGTGIVLVFRNYDKFAKKNQKGAHEVLNIIQNNAWRFLLEDESLKLLAFVQSNDPWINFPELGTLSAEWNPDEWLNKSRGL